MKIGLIGFGGVGREFVKLLREKGSSSQLVYILKSDGAAINKYGLDLDEIVEKRENLKTSVCWREGYTFNEAIQEPVDFIVELTPTNLTTGEPALTYIRTALSRGIHVVTGNKGPVLQDYEGLMQLARKNGVTLGIGCTTGGALPSIALGQSGCAGAEILAIEGVLNGTTNFILQQMEDKGLTFEEALKDAQRIGIAEADPKMDIEGFDTAVKMAILVNVVMGQKTRLEEIVITGISRLTREEMMRAQHQGMKIKLLGQAVRQQTGIQISVKPVLLLREHPLFHVDGTNKGVTYKTDTLGEITVSGGASSPRNAAAAVLRDIFIAKGSQ